VKEKKDRVDDALNATRAAVEEGIVPGGGVALLRAKKSILNLNSDNADVQAGIKIVLKALESPIRQIAQNSGVDGSIVVGKVMENESNTFGFDAQLEDYKDLVQGRHHRPHQGRAHRAAGRRFDRRPAGDRQRPWSPRCRKRNRLAAACPAAAWAAWAAGWTSNKSYSAWKRNGAPGAPFFCLEGGLGRRPGPFFPS
jgi:hypothetical protein